MDLICGNSSGQYGIGAVNEAFFPSAGNRLRKNIHIFPEFTIFVTTWEAKVISLQIWNYG